MALNPDRAYLQVMRAIIALLICLGTCAAYAQGDEKYKLVFRELGSCAMGLAEKVDVNGNADTLARRVVASCEKYTQDWQKGLQDFNIAHRNMMKSFAISLSGGPVRAVIIERQRALSGK